SDFDGLTDGDEVFRTGTDPTNPDTDGDGILDGAEQFGVVDTDGGGLDDQTEAAIGPDRTNRDTDGDGWCDGAAACCVATDAGAVGGGGCYTELGDRCDPVQQTVDDEVEQTKGTNNLVQDVVLDNCSEGFCISTKDATHDGTRPYCTIKCESDNDCNAAAGI